MAITIKGYPHDGGMIDHVGLSGDTKPTTGIGVGSTFYESDTYNKFIWSGTAWILDKTTTITGVSSMPTPASYKLNSVNTTNSNNIKASVATVFNVTIANLSATNVRYVKLYDKATAPTVGTDVPVATFIMQPNTSQCFNLGTLGMRFTNGLGVGITHLYNDSDTTAVGNGDIKMVVNYI